MFERRLQSVAVGWHRCEVLQHPLSVLLIVGEKQRHALILAAGRLGVVAVPGCDQTC
jgi:hypothetical protein